ncbi:transglutaminase family protein [Noviherbaspirillum denitrificans]|uniref:Transglutaminase n=1 Tax=Noviherbaspirillum denitrificans TaxID=1968433 RepID=A0A254THP4_9BURK|nr:transglutaminase family protein [Noviherbaspirillum denitrificans]OWW20832.1 transglutaminase [Noviherbaspirillum denitrificans]
MLLSIRHETVYHYTAPLTYTIQQLRLSPRVEPHQQVRSWEVRTAGRRNEFLDAFGNIGHMLTITGLHDEVRILAGGTVAVDPLDCGRLAGGNTLSPLVFTVPTRLTEPDGNIVDFAMRHLRPGARSSALLALAEAICGSVDYRKGATEVTTPAADALRLGQGVCQDHAHLFLSCCHVHGIPARYVSGYIDPGDTEHAASHAWVDVWVEEIDFTGWVSIDVTHACFAGDAHCRLAIGRDYDWAAPVRGVRHGGGEEALKVHVDVSPIST